MAKRVVTALIDDLDGSEAVGTWQFGYAGYDYEIDLSEANAEALRAAMAPFVKAARVRQRAVSNRKQVAEKREYSLRVRAFAKEHNIPCPAKGRLPGHVVRQFEQGYPDAALPQADDMDTSAGGAVAAAVEAKEKPKRVRARKKVAVPEFREPVASK